MDSFEPPLILIKIAEPSRQFSRASSHRSLRPLHIAWQTPASPWKRACSRKHPAAFTQ